MFAVSDLYTQQSLPCLSVRCNSITISCSRAPSYISPASDRRTALICLRIMFYDHRPPIARRHRQQRDAQHSPLPGWHLGHALPSRTARSPHRALLRIECSQPALPGLRSQPAASLRRLPDMASSDPYMGRKVRRSGLSPACVAPLSTVAAKCPRK
ncbi:hypothetical protein BD310DRAFT_153065 [Dichomitus squalens]|uniref:Uncharacterized protein n=1 Tax=Dichomitus squalens TaxID=114155 RepID=A0A4Q9Q4U5_9APHY|nr:hypothetical protein BD310DRAFT_153065 [Dichomitus squalens]